MLTPNVAELFYNAQLKNSSADNRKHTVKIDGTSASVTLPASPKNPEDDTELVDLAGRVSCKSKDKRKKNGTTRENNVTHKIGAESENMMRDALNVGRILAGVTELIPAPQADATPPAPDATPTAPQADAPKGRKSKGTDGPTV